MLTCSFCHETGTMNDFEIDIQHIKGFWCPSCDGFTYFEDTQVKHNFKLVLEQKKISDSAPGSAPTTPIRFKKQLSPLRYPGGKSKLINYLYYHLNIEKCDFLISPFAGGGSFELAMLEANVAKRIHLNDIDFGIYSLWWVILNIPFALIERIKYNNLNHDAFFNAQKIIKNNYINADMVDAAWATLVVNRLAFSGIAKANPLGGKNGSIEKLLSRWNSEKLINRILDIHKFADRITITNEDAIDLIEDNYWREQTTIFIDPPYVEKGKALYNFYYTEKNHIELCLLLDSLHHGCPGADIVVTYDYNEWIQNMYQTPKQYIVGRNYSISS